MQTSYNTLAAKGSPGQIASEEKYNGISRTIETAAGILFGQPAYRGSSDHGAVAGGTFAATGAGTARAGNVGTSTITASPAITVGASAGRYTFTQTATSSTSPVQVFDPNGLLVATGAVGTAITTIPGITSVTITAAGTPTAGDTFFVDVTYTSNVMFLGLTVKTLSPENGAIAPVDGYSQNTTAAIMTEGQMYVTAGATVTQGQRVYWNPATSRFTNNTAHIQLPSGVRFDTGGVNGDIVEVNLGNRRV
jgi:hypothetical protein